MEIQRTNDLVYTPYAMLAADTEKVVNALEDQFLNFGPDNDNTENMARLAWALFSRCSYTLPKKKKDGAQDARKKYEELCKEFSRECELYQKGELEYDFFRVCCQHRIGRINQIVSPLNFHINFAMCILPSL